MVQGMANGELHKHLAYWKAHHQDSFVITRDGYNVTCDFADERDAIVFILTFKPDKDYWWANARIER